jgi:methylated-DNA-[protein]-cysteine S-methyltransferase
MTLSAHYCLFETAFGVCGIAWRGGAVARLRLPHASAKATEESLRAFSRQEHPAEPTPAMAALIARLKAYFAGEETDFSQVAVDVGGGEGPYPAIYAAVQALPWGRTATYGEIARRAGAPASAQMVGQAMARNPAPIIVPCHRVLAAGNTPGGFSAYGGVATKERLLAMEGVRLDITPRLPGL